MSIDNMVKIDMMDALSDVFVELIKNKEQQREIDDYLMTKHNISRGTLNELLVSPEKFENYSEDEKSVFINAIYEVTKNESIIPSNFYSQKQLTKIKKYKKESEQELSLPYTFGNYVIQSSENDYLTSLRVKEVVDLWNSNILKYNMELQRKPKEKTNKKGQIIKSPKVIQKSVNEIAELMRRRRFRSNAITLCILMDGNSEITYDEGELTLVSGDMFIIDGFHRLSAGTIVIEEDPQYDDFYDVAIKYLTFDEARYYLGQLNKMSKFDKSFVNYLMNDRIQDKIVTELERRSSLRGRITKEANVPKKKTYLTSFNVLSNGIKDIFDPQDNKDRIDIAETLIYFYDYLIGSYPEDFSEDLDKLIKARDHSLRNYHNTHVIYLVIAKALYDKYGKGSNIPSNEIIRLVDSFDYSKDGEYAKVLFSEGTGKVNSNQVKRNIKKYAEEKVKQLLSN